MWTRRKVVVTGLGLVTPLGTGVARAWRAAVEGGSGVGPITRFDASNLRTRFAGEATDFVPNDWMDARDARKNDRFIQFALAAARMAIEDSGLEIDDGNSSRIGVFIGSGMGGIETIENTYKKVLEKSPKRISPFFIPQTLISLASGQVSIALGARYGNLSHVSACASGAHAIGEALDHIRSERADAIIAGGTEAAITLLSIGGFNAMKALSTRNDDPLRASRPFDADRDGFVVGEGAGILVLEAEEHARDRGARIYAELRGYGLTSDAYHVTVPAPGGEGAVRCMRMALEDARIEPAEVGYVNAHGTSTRYNDAVETAAIKTVFGKHARNLAVSSTKSMTGHLLGAAGAIEAVFSVLAIRHGVVPPTINCETHDPECDLDYVPNEARQREIRTAISNSFGFGGTNAVLVFSRGP